MEADQQRHIAVEIHPLTVDLIEDVPGLDGLAVPGLELRRRAGGRRDQKPRRAAVHRQDNEKPRQKVHKGSGCEDHQLLEKALAAQGPLVRGGLVLPLHGAEAADGQQAQGVLGLPRVPVPDQGAHADGELVDPHAAELCRGEVAELVDGDQHAEDQDGRQDIHNGHGKAPVKRNTVTPGPAPPVGPHGPPPGCPPETDPAPQSPPPGPRPPVGGYRKSRSSPPGTGPRPPRWRR